MSVRPLTKLLIYTFCPLFRQTDYLSLLTGGSPCILNSKHLLGLYTADIFPVWGLYVHPVQCISMCVSVSSLKDFHVACREIRPSVSLCFSFCTWSKNPPPPRGVRGSCESLRSGAVLIQGFDPPRYTYFCTMREKASVLPVLIQIATCPILIVSHSFLVICKVTELYTIFMHLWFCYPIPYQLVDFSLCVRDMICKPPSYCFNCHVFIVSVDIQQGQYFPMNILNLFWGSFVLTPLGRSWAHPDERKGKPSEILHGVYGLL